MKERYPFFYIPPAEHTNGKSTQGIDNQIPHCVRQTGRVSKHWFLYVGPKYLVHAELEDFPERTGSHSKNKGKQGDEARLHMEVNSLMLVENIDEKKNDNTQEKAEACMQQNIPPSEACVEVPYLAKKKGSKYEDNNKNLKLYGNCLIKPFAQNFRRDDDCNGQKNHKSGQTTIAVRQQGEYIQLS